MGMDNNIFEGAKFGDKFLTNKGNIALFDCRRSEDSVIMYIEDVFGGVSFNHWFIAQNNGEAYLSFFSTDDEHIVSRYQEPIDENKLDELAKKDCPASGSYGDGYIEGFKDGYHKAKEE